MLNKGHATSQLLGGGGRGSPGFKQLRGEKEKQCGKKRSQRRGRRENSPSPTRRRRRQVRSWAQKERMGRCPGCRRRNRRRGLPTCEPRPARRSLGERHIRVTRRPDSALPPLASLSLLRSRPSRVLSLFEIWVIFFTEILTSFSFLRTTHRDTLSLDGRVSAPSLKSGPRGGRRPSLSRLSPARKPHVTEGHRFWNLGFPPQPAGPRSPPPQTGAPDASAERG